jgi:replicative DNA helicase
VPQLKPDKAYTPLKNDEAEQSIIGGTLWKSEYAGIALRLLTPACFYSAWRQNIFQAIKDLWDKGLPIDLITVDNALKTPEEKFELLDCNHYDHRGAHIDYYSKIVRDLFLMRRTRMRIETGLKEIEETNSFDIGELLGNLTDDLLTYKRQSEYFNESLSPAELTDKMLVDIDQRKDAFDKNEQIGIPTGWEEFDRRTSGLEPGDTIILAGRPSMGKSDSLINIMNYAAMMGYPGLIITLEMSAVAVWKRVAALHNNIYRGRMRDGRLSDGQVLSIHQKSQKLRQLPLSIVDKAQKQIRLRDIRSLALEHKHKTGLKILGIDYIGLITPPKSFSREREVAQISAGLKSLAQELQIPIIIVSQLSRGLEMRDSRRPRLSDLRDSGSIEQDADMVMLIYRSSYYSDIEKPDKKVDPINDKIDIDLAKNRNGEIFAMLDVPYNRAIGRIGDSKTPETEPEPEPEPYPVIKDPEEPF